MKFDSLCFYLQGLILGSIARPFAMKDEKVRTFITLPPLLSYFPV